MPDGDFYSRCPRDGCLEVDAKFTSEGRGAGKEGVHDWSIFSADMRDGGCGHTWAPATKTGTARDHALGREPAWKTRSAAADATTMVLGGSGDWDERYRLAFGHD